MIYGSVCSGIEAASVAWHELGWRAAWFAEIAPFPSRVLAHHWPAVRNWGDFRGIADDTAIDLLVGGTPCQSFSVAGLRGGLDDDRGNLALEFCRLADRLRPAWVLWENVPGVLSSGGGRDFGSILGALENIGYGWAYRTLDAQYFGVPQRRRRVFLVGHLGGWRGAAAVLFERQGLRRDPPPRRAPGAEVAGTLGAGAPGSGWRDDIDRAGAFVSGTLTTREGGRQDPSAETYVAHTLRGVGFDASDGSGRGTPIIPIQAAQRHQNGSGIGKPGAPMFTLDTRADHAIFFDAQITHPENRTNPKPRGPAPSLARANRIALAFEMHQDPGSGDVTNALGRRTGGRGVQTGTGVRRLTPMECERLQGFPDGFTALPDASDSARYEALGNSMAVPVMRWIGRRIDAVSRILKEISP